MKGHVSDLIDEALKQFCIRKDITILQSLIDTVAEYGNWWRPESCSHEALRSFEEIQWGIRDKLPQWGYKDEGLLEKLDKTDLYLNMSWLCKDQEDDDGVLLYLWEADNEHARTTGSSQGTFFRKMIDDKDSPLWNFSNTIKANCSHFMPGIFGAYEFQGVFNRDLTEPEFHALLKDLDLPLLIQFLHTTLMFWETLTSTKGMVRLVKLTRVLGELAYVFECYLGSQAICAGATTLFEKLNALISKDAALTTEFMRNHQELPKHRDSLTRVNAELEELSRRMEAGAPGSQRWIYCLLFVHRVRNHTAHDLDERFVLNARPDLVKKVFLSTIMAFFVARRLLGVWQ